MRFERKKILQENIGEIMRFHEKKELDIANNNYEIYLQDEVSFEINKRTNRILMPKKKKIKLKLEDNLHEGFKVCGFISMAGKSILQIMKGNKGDDFRNMIIDFAEGINNDKLKIVIVDNNKIHFTINVLIECLKRNVLIIPLPKCSPHLNPIEQLWRVLKREIRAKYSKIEEMKEGVFKFAKENLFPGLIRNYWIRYLTPNL